jgi:hypothetical protein
MKTFKKMIMKDLKNHPNIREKITSIRYRSFSMGDAVDVDAINLHKEEREILESILNEYEAGYFDGMTDMYEYKRGPSTKERTAKYVHLHNEFSDLYKQAAKNYLAKIFDVIDDATAMAKWNCWYDTLIYRELCKI